MARAALPKCIICLLVKQAGTTFLTLHGSILGSEISSLIIVDFGGAFSQTLFTYIYLMCNTFASTRLSDMWIVMIFDSPLYCFDVLFP